MKKLRDGYDHGYDNVFLYRSAQFAQLFLVETQITWPMI